MCQKCVLLFNTVKVENVSSRTAADGPKSSTNIADEMQTLLSRLSAKNEDFVRSVCILLHQEPIIILYSTLQIKLMTYGYCARAIVLLLYELSWV